MTESVFPDLALSEEFATANMLTVFLLEGMAVNGLIRGPVPEKMIPWLKDQLRDMFSDVNSVDRNAARETEK